MNEKKLSKKSKTNLDTKKEERIPIEFYVPEGGMTPFATNILIQTIENEFKVSFFELKPVVRLNSSQPLPSHVRADLVASVIITPERFAKFIDAMQTQLDKYIAGKQKKQNIS